MSIKKVISKELSFRYSLNESKEKIINEKDEVKRFYLVVEYLEKMINEGYDEKMINEELNEGWWDTVKGWFGGGSNTPGTKQSGSSDSGVLSNVGGGVWSQIKEWLISKFLGWVGFKGPLADSISTALSEMSVSDLMAVFKGRESCSYHGATVADAITEAIARYIMETSFEANSIGSNFFRNTIFEYFKNSQAGESIAKFICNAAYNMKQKGGMNLGGLSLG